MIDWLSRIDRRWIFLLMGLAVALPILFQLTFPERPTGLAVTTFEAIEELPPGTPVLLSFDFDPASEGELGPMATAFVRHCAEKRLRMCFMTLWPVGVQMIEEAVERVLVDDFPDYEYGVGYVNLGFKTGNEAVIKVITTDLRQTYPTDRYGTPLAELPMMQGIRSIRDFPLIINVSAGYPGTKEWVQYAVTPYSEEIVLVAGCTGVQAPLLYPYIPEQLPGLLGAIKGAAEYEALVLAKYGENIPLLGPDGEPMLGEDGEVIIPGKYLEGIRRMGPQLIAHVLMIVLIVVGNVIFFVERKRRGVR